MSKIVKLKPAEEYGGNGTVFVLYDNTKEKFRKCNFDVRRMDIYSKTHQEILNGVVVALGYDTSRRTALKALKWVISQLDKSDKAGA
jgi:hypothetical protein